MMTRYRISARKIMMYIIPFINSRFFYLRDSNTGDTCSSFKPMTVYFDDKLYDSSINNAVEHNYFVAIRIMLGGQTPPTGS